MRELVATKSFAYGTRRLRAGDYFTAQTTGDERVLLALKNAKAKPSEGGESPTAAVTPPKPKKAATKPRSQRKPPVRKPATKS